MQFHRGHGAALPAAAGRAPPPSPGGRRASRPELPRVLGQVPAVALADEIEAGNIRALVVTGGNPLTAFPRAGPPARRAGAPRRARGRRRRRERAHRASPPTCCRRPASSSGPTSRSPSPRRCAAGCRRPDRWSRPAPTGGRCGGCSPRSTRRWVGPRSAASTPICSPTSSTSRGVLGHAGARRRRRVRRRRPRDPARRRARLGAPTTCCRTAAGRSRPAPLVARLAAYRDPGAGAVVLAPRREMAWSNSVAYGGAIRRHPGARAPGRVAADRVGDVATLTTAHGSVTTTVVADPAVRAGVVSMTHGHAASEPGRRSRAASTTWTRSPRCRGSPASRSGSSPRRLTRRCASGLGRGHEAPAAARPTRRCWRCASARPPHRSAPNRCARCRGASGRRRGRRT